MSVETASKVVDSYTVAAKECEDAELELVHHTTGKTYDVVDYADPILEAKFKGHGTGSSVRVDLAPVETDDGDDLWMVTRLLPGGPPRTGLAR
ncbi:hypothetical protein [Haloarcula marina]|uniref:hypothetical protein n=1 Tax=Haloarcula marina TaxID=2961574 RepID=UPI0020B84DAD|nr:hypothetical protein [Halomicroarcula marina]